MPRGSRDSRCAPSTAREIEKDVDAAHEVRAGDHVDPVADADVVRMRQREAFYDPGLSGLKIESSAHSGDCHDDTGSVRAVRRSAGRSRLGGDALRQPQVADVAERDDYERGARAGWP